MNLYQVLQFLQKDITLHPKTAQTLKQSDPKRDPVRLSLDELQAFVQIQNSGLSLVHCIELSFAEHQKILNDLNAGFSLTEIIRHSRCTQAALVDTLLEALSLEKTLETIFAMQQCSKDLESKVIRSSAYPLFLLGFSYAMIIFFRKSILPAMSAYGTESQDMLLSLLFWMFSLLWIVLLTGLISYFIVFCTKLRVPPLERLLQRIRLIQQMQTAQLSRLMQSLFSSGLSTKDALVLMTAFKSTPFVRRCADAWLKKMEQGMSFCECIVSDPALDPSFQIFMQTGIESAHTEQLLQAYYQKTLTNLEKAAKKLSLSLQLLSYGCVGVLVITVYQVMFIPLNMLDSF